MSSHYSCGLRAATLLACLCNAAPAPAQTGLLVAAREGSAEWQASVRTLMADVHWPYGPVELVFVSEAERGIQAWSHAVTRLSSHGLSAIVAVPLSPDQPAAHQQLVRFLSGQAAPSDPLGRVTAQQPPTLPTPVLIAAAPADMPELGVSRWVEHTALAALRGERAGGDIRPAAYRMPTINVTATRSARSGFGTPSAVAVVDRAQIRERAPNNVADLFREIPGLDVEGVGANQRRPAIRGLVGQRVLLLQDGLRLNNSRRRQDSGETPALVDLSSVERVEVVRGAASVLYGSDAVGGVVNVITVEPDRTATAPLTGDVALRYGTAGNQAAPSASVRGTLGPLSVRAAGSYRHAESYRAPRGRFGTVRLRGDTRVEDTGGEDVHAGIHASLRLASGHTVVARHERYQGNDAGFGYVDPELLGDGLSTIQILFPTQRFARDVVGYRGANLPLPMADNLAVAGYWQSNERLFVNNIFSPTGSSGGGVAVASRSFTDIDTHGFRIEAKRVVSGRLVFTYGTDYFRERARNTDSTTRTITGAGPTVTRERGTPRVPTSTFRSLGAFLQADVAIAGRASVVLGGRYQDVRARSLRTAGVTEPLVDATDRTFVGAANLMVRLTGALNAVASVGRAFRSPNLVERFFAGPSPEGRGVWIRNVDLEPETSLNRELGLRYRHRRIELEAFVFRNTIRDGIRVVPTGDMVNGLTEFQNVNVDELRYQGWEAGALGRPLAGVTVAMEYSHVDATNVHEPDAPLGDGYRHKLRGSVRYSPPGERYWGEYVVRYSGRRDDADLGGAPIIAFIPAFTVHAIRGGARLFGEQRLGMSVENLTNTLYAEAANVGFFRPEPKRHLVLTLTTVF
ncbi:MAG TPA: TonB-dependent receptor [Gemmatimonadales bacterium]